MWARTSIAVLAAGVAALVLAGWTSGFPQRAGLFADNRPGSVVVDAELVIAVDVSNSMDPEEQALQREGYILGLTSREFLNALRSGINGKIAVTYFEWAYDQRIVMPWRLIDGPETAAAVTKKSRRHPIAARRAPRSTGRCNLRSRCSIPAATTACAASSTCPVTAPTITGRR